MRIIGGTAGGRILKAPKGFDVRPTADLVRQAVFNSLSQRIDGALVLELFGGTGALSLECLSRGAAGACCVELSRHHARVIRENFALAQLADNSLEVWVEDVFTAIPKLTTAGRQFDLIFADPPYGEKNIGRRSTSFAQRVLDDPNLPQLLAAHGLFILGHTKRDTLALPSVWHEVKLLKHGDSVMRFLDKTSKAG